MGPRYSGAVRKESSETGGEIESCADAWEYASVTIATKTVIGRMIVPSLATSHHVESGVLPGGRPQTQEPHNPCDRPPSKQSIGRSKSLCSANPGKYVLSFQSSQTAPHVLPDRHNLTKC